MTDRPLESSVGQEHTATRSLVSRRGFLGAAAAAGLVVAGPRWVRGPLLSHSGDAPTLSGPPFTLGVASGDPLPDGVVLWTRLAPDPQAPDWGMPPQPVPVRWEVANDEAFRHIARKGTAMATPDAAHSVHVDARGLEPAHDYFYRFRVGDHESPVARTRTAPAADADVQRLRLAFASCQSYRDGFFTAHRHLADEDVDLVLFLGDYIYEEAASSGHAREAEGPEPVDVAGYRRRYGTYKADPDLQAAHAAFPWMVTWDDHEVKNNYAGDLSQNDVIPPDVFRVRRAAAYQVWWEHTPARVRRPTSPDARIYRSLALGRLAEIQMLDTRQYRSNQPCGTPTDIGIRCAEAAAPEATLTGAAQEKWLLDGLRRSDARWNVIAQQVLMAQANFDPAGNGFFDLDAWDGYPAARQRLLDGLAKVRNPVVLSGDIHCAWVNNLSQDFEDPSAKPVATEIVGTSVTSGFPLSETVKAAVANQPHIKYFEGDSRGYVRCELTKKEWRADHRYVSTILDPAATVATGASFVIEAGAPGAEAV